LITLSLYLSLSLQMRHITQTHTHLQTRGMRREARINSAA
jgi:hypothetical protein